MNKLIDALREAKEAMECEKEAWDGTCTTFDSAIEACEEALKEVKDRISITWCLEDVLSCAVNNGVKITKNQAREVLSYLKHKHDASIGINWDVIQAIINEKVWVN